MVGGTGATGAAGSGILTTNNLFTGINSFRATSFNEETIFLRTSTDANHILKYLPAPTDGFQLLGYHSAKLGVNGNVDMLTLNRYNGVEVNSSHKVNGVLGVTGLTTLNTLTTTGATTLNSTLAVASGIALKDSALYLKQLGDENVILKSTINNGNGFQLTGLEGGVIGTVAMTDMMVLTNSSGVKLKKPITIGTSGTSCNSMQFGSFIGVSNATQTVTFTTPFTGVTIPKVILTVVNSGQVFPTGSAFIVSESLTGFLYNFSFITSATFNHAENGVTINWMALQG